MQSQLLPLEGDIGQHWHRTTLETIKELRLKQCDVKRFYSLFFPTELYFLDAISQHDLHFHIHSQLWYGARSVPIYFLNQVFIVKIHIKIHKNTRVDILRGLTAGCAFVYTLDNIDYWAVSLHRNQMPPHWCHCSSYLAIFLHAELNLNFFQGDSACTIGWTKWRHCI